jgi:hypothetical protein
MRASDFILIASLFLVALADAALTYLIIVSGVGYEANPVWQIFNYEPDAVWSVGLMPDMIAILLITVLMILAYMSHLTAAVKIVRYTALAMAASRCVVVLNNAAVYFAHTNLIPVWLFP